ncbi:hypothetical protein M8494_18985 [Serratia ureilytica]
MGKGTAYESIENAVHRRMPAGRRRFAGGGKQPALRPGSAVSRRSNPNPPAANWKGSTSNWATRCAPPRSCNAAGWKPRSTA